MKAAEDRTAVRASTALLDQNGARLTIMTVRNISGIALVFVLAAIPAAAQDVGGPRVTVAFGAGRVNPLPVTLPYTAPTWTASVQIAAAKHLIVEGIATAWQHTTTSSSTVEMRDQTGTPFIRDATVRTRDGKSTVGVNALAAAKLGRVRLSSGAGVAFGFFSTRTGETVTACTLPVPNACDGFAESFQLRLFSIQCVLGATVPVTSRIQAFVAYRLVQPFTYGLGEINFVSGMQVAVR